AVEPHVAAVPALHRVLGPDDDAADDVAGLHLAARQRLLHAADDLLGDPGLAARHAALAGRAAAEHLDAHHLLGTAVVGDVQVGLLLNHRSPRSLSLSLSLASACHGPGGGGAIRVADDGDNPPAGAQ